MKLGRDVLLVLTLVATAWTVSGQVNRAPAGNAPRIPRTAPADTAALAVRRRFLEMFARAYFPGRTGQLLIVPREGDFITRPDPDVAYMHGSPWGYDVSIPLMFAGPAAKTEGYSIPAAQQDVASTLAATLGIQMPATATGRVLPVLRAGFARPRAVMVIVLDGMRRDYFDRYAGSMPTLAALRKSGAWFTQAQVNFVPTNTAVGHSTIATGADPRVHGITGVSMYDRIHRQRHDVFAGGMPQDLMALTLSDAWQLATAGRAIVLAQGSIDRAATPLAGHGSCQLNGVPTVLASHDLQTGNWNTNPGCFRLPAYLKDRNASTLWRAGGEWMQHKIDSSAAVRYSALFPAFEADAMVEMIEREPWAKRTLVTESNTCLPLVGDVLFYVAEPESLSTAAVLRNRFRGALDYACSKGSDVVVDRAQSRNGDRGSPIHSLYERFLQSSPETRAAAAGTFFRQPQCWINFTREGDYIGASIGCAGVKEINLGAGGHTAYWKLPELWRSFTAERS